MPVRAEMGTEEENDREYPAAKALGKAACFRPALAPPLRACSGRGKSRPPLGRGRRGSCAGAGRSAEKAPLPERGKRGLLSLPERGRGACSPCLKKRPGKGESPLPGLLLSLSHEPAVAAVLADRLGVHCIFDFLVGHRGDDEDQSKGADGQQNPEKPADAPPVLDGGVVDGLHGDALAPTAGTVHDGSLLPVSYTHLDVYKRQFLDLLHLV